MGPLNEQGRVSRSCLEEDVCLADATLRGRPVGITQGPSSRKSESIPLKSSPSALPAQAFPCPDGRLFMAVGCASYDQPYPTLSALYEPAPGALNSTRPFPRNSVLCPPTQPQSPWDRHGRGSGRLRSTRRGALLHEQIAVRKRTLARR